MTQKLILSVFVVCALAVTSVEAQVDVFFSTSNTDPNAGSAIDIASVGDMGSLYVWVTNNDVDTMDGLALDITSSDDSILEGVSHLIENPGNRWTATQEGNLGDLLDDSNAFALLGFGGNGVANDATPVFHSEIQFLATGLGDATLELAEGNATISINGSAAQSLSFGRATVSVGASVPEPGTCGLGMVVVSLVCMRRKRNA